MRKSLKVAMLAATACAGLAACDYHGEGLDNPVGRRAVWFSFLSGDDIRQSCKPGAPDHLRLVYNGRWYEQVRIYEVTGKAPYLLDQRVIGPADLSHVSVNTLTDTWGGKTALTEVSSAQYQAVADGFTSALKTVPTPVDATFASDSYYWVGSGCQGGQFVFGAWQYGKPGFDALAFSAPLLAADHTGIAYNQPHDPDSMDLANKPMADKQRWYIRIYADHVGGAIGF